jgi:hypothetical protein
MDVTWKPVVGVREPRSKLPDTAFAFPNERKEPMTDAAHVRDAIGRFGQVSGTTESERTQALANIKAAAAYYGVHLCASSGTERIG